MDDNNQKSNFRPPVKFELMMLLMVSPILMMILASKLDWVWLKPIAILTLLIGMITVFRNWYAQVKYHLNK